LCKSSRQLTPKVSIAAVKHAGMANVCTPNKCICDVSLQNSIDPTLSPVEPTVTTTTTDCQPDIIDHKNDYMQKNSQTVKQRLSLRYYANRQRILDKYHTNSAICKKQALDRYYKNPSVCKSKALNRYHTNFLLLNQQALDRYYSKRSMRKQNMLYNYYANYEANKVRRQELINSGRWTN